jgi:septum formation protein
VTTVVLASASVIRRTLLENAGVSLVVDPADVDESAIKERLIAQRIPTQGAAIELASAKAKAISTRHPGKLIVGADQILEHAGKWFDKPVDRAAAAAQLSRLAGTAHSLISAVAVIEDGVEVWRTAQSATLHMRPLSPDYIESYLARVGNAALTSVGGYQLEGLGAQLFTRVDGDYFTVLGLPLLPLLTYLRDRGVLAT